MRENEVCLLVLSNCPVSPGDSRLGYADGETKNS